MDYQEKLATLTQDEGKKKKIKQHRTLVIAVISIVIRYLARNILLLILNNKQQKRKVGTKHVMLLYIGSSILY